MFLVGNSCFALWSRVLPLWFKSLFMIQDIAPHRFSNEYLVSTIADSKDFIFHFQNDSLLLKQHNGELQIPVRGEFCGNVNNGIFLFTLNATPCYLADACTIPNHQEFDFHEITFFRTISQKEVAYASILALQLMHWYGQNRYCGKCGAAVIHKPDERALLCPSCGNIIYPKISPAVIVAIICNDRILLAKGANFRGGFYSLVAGYADVGETLEEAVVREVKEELGLDVKDIRYYSSQPWPLSGSMMIGFIAHADDRQPIIMDKKEILDAAWFARDQLPNHPSADISIAGEIIDKFKKFDPEIK